MTPASASPAKMPLTVTFEQESSSAKDRSERGLGEATHESGSLQVSRSNREALDGSQDARVGESRLGADDAVGDVVLQGRVLLLLDLLNGAVLWRRNVSPAQIVITLGPTVKVNL